MKQDYALTIAFTLGTMLVAGSASAQASNPEEPTIGDVARDDIIDQFRTVGSAGPADKDGHGASGELGVTSALQISATDGNAFVDLSVAIINGDVDTKKIGEGDYEVKAWNNQFTLNANVPINKNEKGNFADLKKIGNDAKLKLAYTHFSSKRITGKTLYTQYYPRFARTCLIEAGRKWLGEQFPVATTAQQVEASNLVKRFDEKIANAMDWSQTVNDAADGLDNFGPVAKAACTLGSPSIGNAEDLERQYAAKTLSAVELADFRAKITQRRKLTFWGFSATGGYQKHDVLDRTNFRIDTVDRVGFDATAYLGQIMADNKFSWRLSGGYARGYESADEIDFCRAVGTGQECLKGQDGLPVRKNSAYGKAEARITVFSDDMGRPRVALAPEITYDVKGNDWAFDLPIYLQRNEKKGLDGGIRLGYQTKDDDFGIGVFVGIPFSTWF